MEDRAGDLTIAWYQIRVRGHLDERRIQRFEGMAATLLEGGETLLTGPIVDQAALHGILSRIRDMGVTLVEVCCVDPHRS